MQKRATAVLALVALACLAPLTGQALTAYYQDFEGLVLEDPAALGNDGWWVFGNVFTPEGDYMYGYGPFPAPNHSIAFCALVVGQGGPDQGAQQLVVFSDYENGDHANGNIIESNVFQEQTVGAEDVGETWIFSYDATLGNIEGASTAAGFIKTLDPANGWALTNFLTADMTSIPVSWQYYAVEIIIDESLVGQILQFGFLNTATHYEGSGIYYDNVNFFEAISTDGPVSPSSGLALSQNYPNPFNPKTRIEFTLDEPGQVELSVFDLAGRKVAILQQGNLPAGEHRVTWNGADQSGRRVASGRYCYVLDTPAGTVSRGMTLLK